MEEDDLPGWELAHKADDAIVAEEEKLEDLTNKAHQKLTLLDHKAHLEQEASENKDCLNQSKKELAFMKGNMETRAETLTGTAT